MDLLEGRDGKKVGDTGTPCVSEDKEGLPPLPLCGLSARRASAARLTVHLMEKCCAGFALNTAGPGAVKTACPSNSNCRRSWRSGLRRAPTRWRSKCRWASGGWGTRCPMQIAGGLSMAQQAGRVLAERAPVLPARRAAVLLRPHGHASSLSNTARLACHPLTQAFLRGMVEPEMRLTDKSIISQVRF